MAGWDQFTPVATGDGWSQFKPVGAAMQQTGPQPTFMQTVAASPIGRLTHDVVGPINNFIMGAAKNFSADTHEINPKFPAIPQNYNPIENAYQAALSAQRNRPGYAETRQEQDSMRALSPSGFQDQVIAPFAPALAGIAGLLTGGLNGMNAAADAQTQGQQDYQQAHPVKAAAGNVLGGFMAMPEGASTAAQTTFRQPYVPSSPQVAAREYVNRLMRGKAPADLDAAATAANGKPITAAEAIGKPAEVGVGALARREGATADALGGEMAARGAAAPGRILDDFSAASGIDPRLAQGDIEGYIASGRQTVKPMFDQALAGDQGVWNTDLARLSNRPVVQRAMRDVVEDLRNADIDPSGLGFTGQDPVTGKFIQTPRPTAQAWDMVKKRLGKSVERDSFGKIIPDSISPGNYSINGASRDLTGTLRDTIPGYGDALDASGDYLSMQKAFNDGQSFILNPKVTAAQVQSHISKLSPSEARAFKGGIANKMFDMQQNGRLAAKFADAPSIQAKLTSALGQQNAATFLKSLGTEKSMANFARLRVPGAGSPTAEYNAAMADQDANSALATHGLQFAGNAVQHGLVRATGNLAMDKGKDALAAWLTRGMAIPVRDEAGRLLMMHPSDLAHFLSQGAPLAAATTAQSAPALTSASRIPYGLAPFGFPLLANQTQ